MKQINLMDLEIVEESIVNSVVIPNDNGNICGILCRGGNWCGIWCWP